MNKFMEDITMTKITKTQLRQIIREEIQKLKEKVSWDSFRKGSSIEVIGMNLKTLKGAPETVRGDFRCSYNELKSLEGAPKVVSRNFECGHNKLTTLQGGPKVVGGDFTCWHNKLTTLQGAPETVKGHFHCNDNKLTSLQGAPKTVGGVFDCSNNSKKFTVEDVRKVCDVKDNIIV